MTVEERKDDRHFSSFQEYWAEGDWSPFVETLHVGKNSPHTLAVLDQPAGSFPDPAMPELHMQLITKGSAKLRVEFEGAQVDSTLAPGAIFMAPTNTATNYELDGRHSFISLAINKGAVDRIRDQADVDLPNDFGKLHEQKFHDPIVEALILRMLEEAKLDNPTSDLFLDQATDMILTSLLCRSGTMRPDSEPSRPLSDHDIATVSRMIEGRLEDNLNIADLARVTSLSDWHFARAFKEATGLSPHQYVLRRRIVRAKDLLTNGILPLAEVAVAAGFSSQSHMTDVFRQKVGTAPGKYRAELQS